MAWFFFYKMHLYPILKWFCRYLKERLKQMAEEKSMAMATVSKYKVQLPFSYKCHSFCNERVEL
jgi:hypothetical protein